MKYKRTEGTESKGPGPQLTKWKVRAMQAQMETSLPWSVSLPRQDYSSSAEASGGQKVETSEPLEESWPRGTGTECLVASWLP
jgi:hypothetical protein